MLHLCKAAGWAVLHGLDAKGKSGDDTPLQMSVPLWLWIAQEERQEPDGDFKPNLLNTVCYLVNFAIQVRPGGNGLRGR